MKNFFEHQDEARRNTRTLAALMTLGVVAMGLAIYALLVVVQHVAFRTSADLLYSTPWFQPELLLAVVIGTAVIVLIASASRLVVLRGGGGARVAETLGGRLVSGNPRDVLEKRFVNVLEEMSIASGMPVPRAYVLDGEAGINAFAAGLSTADAVVAVTRGCLETLTREELQGVVAHEMSHVTHGDMRINMRLMGVVFGIVCIALLGRLLLRFGASDGGHVTRRSKDNDGSMRMALLLFGVGLLVIGSLGELFGKLIKSAIGRQREYLADASAVQFTRNPRGIGGALKKIGGFAPGSQVASTRAEEASHMFFSDIHQRLSGLFATHPPLAERIRRVDPSWDGSLPAVAAGIAEPDDSAVAAFSAPSIRRPAADVITSVGTVTPDAVSTAQQWLSDLPPVLRDGAQHAFTACAISYAILWSDDAATAEKQRELLRSLVGDALLDATERLVPIVRSVPRSHCLALTELLSPALHALSPDQRGRFQQAVRVLMDADQRVTLFEHLLGEALSTAIGRQVRTKQSRRLSLPIVARELELLLSLLAHVDAATHAEAETAFQSAASRLPELRMQLLAPADGQLRGLSHCLNTLRALSPSASARIVDAMAHCALANQQVTQDEATLVAAACLALEVPMPVWS